MEIGPALESTMLDSDKLDWAPLEDLVGLELACRFMWMFAVRLADGSRLHAYKDRVTRRYLHLALDGRAFVYTARGMYREVDRETAIEKVYEERRYAQLSESEELALAAALDKARDEAEGE